MARTGRRQWIALLLAGVLATGALAACGGDDDDDAGGDDTDVTVEDTEDETEDTADDEAAGGDVEAYCEAVTEIETIPEPEVDFESMSPEEQQEFAAAFATDELLPLAEEAQANAPEEVAEDIEILVGAVEEVAETGDFAAFDTPETEAAGDNAHAFDVENCDWARTEVIAADYEFQGIEESYEAGVISFDFKNTGAEVHELAIMRKADGVTESFDDLLAMGEEEAEGKVEFVGGIDPILPEDVDYVVADLEAGDYLAICFLPVGATPEVFEAVESGQQEPPEGPPHFTQGMKVEFTVS